MPGPGVQAGCASRVRRRPPAQSRFEIKWSGETAFRAWPRGTCRGVAAVKGEDMRAAGPRTQAIPRKVRSTRKKWTLQKPAMTAILNCFRLK